MFSYLYGLCGRCSDVTMVNSSWTEEHIASLWGGADSIHKIYPPCDTRQFSEIARTPDASMSEYRIVSLGQFRPEKDHPLQIRTMARVRDAIYDDVDMSQEEKDAEWEKVMQLLAFIKGSA